MNTLVRDLAREHRLRTSQHAEVIRGRFGEISSYGEKLLSVTVLAGSSRRWKRRRNLLLSAGCTIVQSGDVEGIAVFDPQDPEQLQAVLRAADIKPKRKVTTKTIQHLARIGKATRFKSNVAQEGAKRGMERVPSSLDKQNPSPDTSHAPPVQKGPSSAIDGPKPIVTRRGRH